MLWAGGRGVSPGSWYPSVDPSPLYLKQLLGWWGEGRRSLRDQLPGDPDRAVTWTSMGPNQAILLQKN